MSCDTLKFIVQVMTLFYEFSLQKFCFRILSLEKLGTVFNQVAYPLEYTPRKMIVHKASGNLIIIETDHAAFTRRARQERRRQLANVFFYRYYYLLV